MSLSDAASALPHHSIVAALESRGYVILDHALPGTLIAEVLAHLESLTPEHFIRAGVGRESVFRRNASVRGDEIHWLEPGQPGTHQWFRAMEDLRLTLNRHLFLGLFDYECHYARYPAGAFYRRHLDAFRGTGNRVVSTVLYLNPGWLPGDGGELLLYAAADDRLLERVEPLCNRLVLFLSTEFPHEVLAARQPRCSLAGWFRVNGSRGDTVDPPR